MTSLSSENDSTYIPPAKLILAGLGISLTDLRNPTVTVSTSFLKRLLVLLISDTKIDEAHYLSKNPDVKGALLGNEVESARDHFLRAGYLEGRLPARLPFDPEWYYGHYKDLAHVFKPEDAEGLYRHYIATGYFEGRVGTAADLTILNNWS